MIECRAGIALDAQWPVIFDENALHSGLVAGAAEGESETQSETQSRAVFRASPRARVRPSGRHNARAMNFRYARAVAPRAEKEQSDVADAAALSKKPTREIGSRR